MTQDANPPRGDFGYFAPRYDAQFREAVRVDYEARDGRTLRDIANLHHIATSTIHLWARAGGWTMRQPHEVDPSDLVARMLSLLDMQIVEMESAMTNGTTEVAMLAKLVTTLDRVLALKDRTAKAQAAPSRKVQALRGKIADRLVELNRA